MIEINISEEFYASDPLTVAQKTKMVADKIERLILGVNLSPENGSFKISQKPVPNENWFNVDWRYRKINS